jgi:integrase
MASVKLYLDKRAKRKTDNKYPLKLSITHKGNAMLSLDIFLDENQFEAGLIVKHPRKAVLNKMLKQTIINAESKLLKLKVSGKLQQMTATDIRDVIQQGDQDPEEKTYLFIDHYRKFVGEKNKPTTIEKYESTLTRIKGFADIDALTFADIDFAWLKEFNEYMAEFAPSVNARNIHLRNIRAIYNDAINEDKASLNDYPFRRFKIKAQATPKRSLSVEQIVQIRDIDWGILQPVADAFLLMFYLIGINIVDLLSLKEITYEGRIEYYRSKTGRFYSIEVLPPAIQLIEKYKGENLLLLWSEKYSNYRNFTKYINKRLDKIGQGIGVPELTSYYARHSWATLAAKLDIPKETIAASLGHGGNSVTDIYIDFDRDKIDKANRMVIDSLS